LLSHAIKTVKNIKTTIKNSQNLIDSIINCKLTTVLKKSSGFKIMMIISKILEREENVKNVIPEDLNASDIVCMKYGQINTADVERSFSMYKHLLTDNRRKLTFDYIKQLLIIQCNKINIKCNYEFITNK